MQRYQLVIGGTIAGIAGVLAFPTHSSHLTIPSAASGTTTGTAPASTIPAGTAPATTPAVRSATSADQQFRFGDLAVKVTVNGTKITDVAVTTLNESDGRSAAIDRYAVPYLEQQVVSAGSVHINGVSGATFTSQAFVDAVSNALQKLGISA